MFLETRLYNKNWVNIFQTYLFKQLKNYNENHNIM